MFFYIAIWIFLLISCACSKKVTWLYFLWLLFFVIVAGGRSIDVGVDTKTYKEVFEIAGDGTFEVWLEPLWSFFCYLYYNYVSTDYNAFLLAVSFITLGNLFYVSYKESPNPFFSIFVYFSLHWYTASFNIMRQHFAAPIILLAWHLYNINKKKTAYLITAIAFGFHDSSLFAFVAYLWNKIKLTEKKIYIVLLATALFGSIMNESLLTRLLPESFQYFLMKEEVFRDNIPMVIALVAAQNLMAVFLIKWVPRDLLSNFWFKTFVLSCAVFNATYMIAYATRIYTVFAICQVIVFPLVISCVNKKRKTQAMMLIFAYLTAQFFRILLHDQNGLIPYKSVFF